MATVTKSIGTSSRDYTTMTLWEADLDNAGVYSSGDDAVGECYNDSVFDEALTLNGGGTVGLNSIKLTAASGEQHNGTAGTGVRNVLSSSTSVMLDDQTSVSTVVIELIEWNANENARTIISNLNHRVQQLLLHGAEDTTSVVYGVLLAGSASSNAHVLNCILYDLTGDTAVIGMETYPSSHNEILNNTVFRLHTNSVSIGAPVAIFIHDVANNNCQNTIATGLSTQSSSTPSCFFPSSPTTATTDHNLSSDSTASGTGSLTDKSAARQFVSTLQGSENLLLKSNADAINSGTDLGTTPTGVNLDILGLDRDSTGVAWDMGANEFQPNASHPQYVPTMPDGASSCGGAESASSNSGSAGTFVDSSCGCGQCTSTLLSSGQMSFNLPLLSVSALGNSSWCFGLNYLSGNGIDGIFGRGFNYPQNLRLNELGNGDVELLSGDNTAELFTADGSGNYTPAANTNTRAVLTRAGTGVNDEFSLTASDGTVSKFFGFDVAITTKGRLKSVSDRFGSDQTYTWTQTSGVDQLTDVTDSYGRKVTYTYYGSEFGHRVQQIEDFLERKLNFQYDSDGHLVAVVTPSITRAADGNEFSGGTGYVFEYDVNNSDENRRDDLIRIWYPNEVEPYLNTSTRTVDEDSVCNRQGIVGRWVFDDGTGTDVVDSSGYYNDGAITGASWTTGPNGETGTALDFDGTDDFVSMSDKSQYDVGQQMSASFWVNGASVTENHIGGHWDTNGQRAWAIVNANGKLRVMLSDDGSFDAGHRKQYTSSVTAFDDSWHHVAFTFDCGVLKLYVDGVEDTCVTKDHDDAIQTLHNSTAKVTFGSTLATGSDTQNFDGKLAIVDFSNISLDATAVADLAAQTPCASPRAVVVYGQDDMDQSTYGRVVTQSIGDPDNDVGGTYQYAYSTSSLPDNIVDSSDPIVFETTVTDRNGNIVEYGFTANNMPARVAVDRNRDKINIPAHGTGSGQFDEFVTWTKYNDNNQPVLVVYPEGNSVEYEYEDGTVSGISGTYNKRVGLLLSETHKVDNPHKSGSPSIPANRDGASNGQKELTRRFFYDPLFQQPIAVIESKGNPVDGSTYFSPQNAGTTPTNSDRSRYATITYLDYQKNQTTTVKNDTDLQDLLGLTAAEIQSLIDHVDNQMKATDGSGGLPGGFEMDLGDINGDGTGDGNTSGLPAANILGNRVKVKHPSVRLIGSDAITTQDREEIFTVNDRGQQTTHTDPEGNLTVWVRYPLADPEGDGRFVASGLGSKQYGRVSQIHADADPNDVLSLVGSDGDLVDFIPGRITRSNTPDEYQQLVTRFEGTSIGAGCGCASCAYDPLGNPLAQTDPRGFTTRYERNELGEVYRTIGPDPYRYQTEIHYDANRNVVRTDVEDQWVQYDSDTPDAAGYAHFVPIGGGNGSHVPSRTGFGGATREGWFTNLSTYDLLDNVVTEDIDATGSEPERLVTSYEYDANQNVTKITKPEGNTVEYDYDERDLRIAERVGNSPDTPAVSITAYGGNGLVIQSVGPAQRGSSGNHKTITIGSAFGGSNLVHTGDFMLENTIDGFNRVTSTKDAVGNVVDMKHDPDGQVVESLAKGPIGGVTPTDRNGTSNKDLAKSIARYDEAGRQYESQGDVFVADTVALASGNRTVDHIGGGLATNSTADDHTGTTQVVDSSGDATANESYVLTRTVHDKASRVVEVIADNTAVSTTDYDGASRAIKQTDALGNKVHNTYDANSNLVHVVREEKSTITDPNTAAEEFCSVMQYDSLNRLVVSAQFNPEGVAS